MERWCDHSTYGLEEDNGNRSSTLEGGESERPSISEGAESEHYPFFHDTLTFARITEGMGHILPYASQSGQVAGEEQSAYSLSPYVPYPPRNYVRRDCEEDDVGRRPRVRRCLDLNKGVNLTSPKRFSISQDPFLSKNHPSSLSDGEETSQHSRKAAGIALEEDAVGDIFSSRSIRAQYGSDPMQMKDRSPRYLPEPNSPLVHSQHSTPSSHRHPGSHLYQSPGFSGNFAYPSYQMASPHSYFQRRYPMVASHPFSDNTGTPGIFMSQLPCPVYSPPQYPPQPFIPQQSVHSDTPVDANRMDNSGCTATGSSPNTTLPFPNPSLTLAIPPSPIRLRQKPPGKLNPVRRSARSESKIREVRTRTSSGESTSQAAGLCAAEVATAGSVRAKAAIVTWYDRLDDLRRFRKEFGDCNVPQKYEPNRALGIWVNKQRMEKKKLDRGERSSMTTERLQALQSVGFQWAKLKGDVSWNQKYTELLEYRSVFGDCNVPTKYSTNPALGRWVSTQRSQFKEFQAGLVTHITDQRISHLEKIGFRWSMMEGEEENKCTNENSLRDGSEADAIFSRSMRVEKAKRWEYDKSRTSSRHSSINRVTSV